MTDDEPHYHGHRQRLRERFLKSGLAGFADYEVVELLLTLAIPRSDVKQPAKALIARFGNLRGILDAPIEELRAVSGIGSVTPVALQIIKATATLYLQQSGEGRDSLADPTRLSEPPRDCRRLQSLRGWSHGKSVGASAQEVIEWLAVQQTLAQR
jgi:DNA repair protein RadC